MSLIKRRTAQEAFEIIRNGLRMQGQASERFLSDDNGNHDPFGFIVGDEVPIGPGAEEMSFKEINKIYLNGDWDDDACEIIELCQQIHDGIEVDDWQYQLGVTAVAEGLIH